MQLCLVTRFSRPYPVWEGRSAEAWAEWLETRLVLLRELTVPSLRNCTVKPDRWYVFVGNHPEEYLARLRTVLAGAGLETVLVVSESGRTIAETLGDELARREAFPLRICTVRLDSDDLVAGDFFARLRACLDGLGPIEEPVGIGFPGGAVLYRDSGTFAYVADADNAFLALAEHPTTPADFAGVYSQFHTELLASLGRAIRPRSFHPMWCSVVHGGNLGNQGLAKVARFDLGDPAVLRRHFGIGS